MQRVCFTFKVKPEGIEEYKEYHKAVWPEMLQALRDCGWRNYTLFMKPDGMITGYVETDDLDAANECMSTKDVNTRWQAEMARFFDKVPNEEPMNTWVEYFHLD